MATTRSQVDWQKTALRLPRDLQQQVHAAAKEDDRTFNGQIVAMLREGVAQRTEKEVQHEKRA